MRAKIARDCLTFTLDYIIMQQAISELPCSKTSSRANLSYETRVNTNKWNTFLHERFRTKTHFYTANSEIAC